MRTVPLYGSKAAERVALVDDQDYDLVIKYRWRLEEDSKGRREGTHPTGPYAATTIRRADGRRGTVRMHTLITGWSRVDHEDHDGLNNQRYNLRDATSQHNAANVRKTRKSTSSQFKGVSWYGRREKWIADITVNHRSCRLGYFTSEIDAARAYNIAAIEAFGEFAYLNEIKEEP